MPKHKWTFKSRFRSRAYSWKGTQLASKRMKKAVSEIKKVAKTDSALAGEGVVKLFIHIRSLCPMVTYFPISDIINQHKTCKAIFHCII